MTASIKEALAAARQFVEHAPGSNAKATLAKIDAALASLSCGEARERIAKMICEDRGVDPMTLYQTSVYQPPDGMSYPEDGHFINWRNEREPMHYAYRRYERVADAILATGCVPGEAIQREYERGYNDGVEWQRCMAKPQ